MAESASSKTGYALTIDGKYYNTLDIEAFSLMMKDPSYCYKFYWLEAIVQLISEGISETTFDAVINEMICNAWYSVREFHIHLSGMQTDGQVRDGLERIVLKLTELSDLPANASKVEIKNAIAVHNEELKVFKEQLTNMVPYRALARFFHKCDETADWDSVRRLIAYIERINRDVVLLPYTLGPESKLKRKIYFQEAWMTMIQDQTVSILGWIQYEKVKWLQNQFDKELQKEYVFCSYLIGLLPKDPVEQIDLEGKLKLEYYKLQKTFQGEIALEEAKTIYVPAKHKGVKGMDEKAPLDEGIAKINEKFKGNFTEGDKVILSALRDKLLSDKKLRKMAQSSDPQIFVESIFPKAFGTAAQDGYMQAQESYQSLFEDTVKYNAIMGALAEVIYREMRRKETTVVEESEVYTYDVPQNLSMVAEGQVPQGDNA